MIARILFPAVVAALALAFALVAQSYPSMSLQQGFGPGLFPTILGVAVGALALLETAIQLRRYLRAGHDEGVKQEEEGGLALREAGAAALLVVSVVASILAIPHVGFIPAGAALVFVLSLAMGMRPVWRTALVSLAIAAAIDLVFTKAFGLVMAF